MMPNGSKLGEKPYLRSNCVAKTKDFIALSTELTNCSASVTANMAVFTSTKIVLSKLTANSLEA